MQKMNTQLAAMDFRVLRFLRLLLQTGSVTRTAELLEIGQPTASRILARIRDLTGDPLLIRTQTGYQLTDHALALQQPVLDAIHSVEAVFQPQDFDPEKSDHQFRVACTDYATACIIGPLMARFATIAPRIQIDVTPLVPTSFSMIADGEVDFAFYAGLDVKGDYIVKKLFDDTYVLLVRDGHPLLEAADRKGVLEPSDIVPFRQIEFNYPTLERLRADFVMRVGHENPSTVFSAPFFTAMPFLVADSDAVAAVPARLGAQLSKFTDLHSVRFRTGAKFPYYLLWHERGKHNPAISWFAGEVSGIVA